MTLSEYFRWISRPIAKEASLPSFFPNGVSRTINILKNRATASSRAKWRSFGARHYPQYLKKPTRKRAIALRNWGFRVPLPRDR